MEFRIVLPCDSPQRYKVTPWCRAERVGPRTCQSLFPKTFKIHDDFPWNNHSIFLNYFQNYEMSPFTSTIRMSETPLFFHGLPPLPLRAAADSSASRPEKSESHNKLPKHSQHPGWPGQSQPLRSLSACFEGYFNDRIHLPTHRYGTYLSIHR